MSVYTSSGFECAHKELARTLVKDINDSGILCFYAGDIPEKIKYDMLDVIAGANERSEVFMPLLCRDYATAGGRLSRSELAVASSQKKFVMPVLLDSEYPGVTPGSLLTGIMITDLSSPAKYETGLPELLRSIRAMIAVAKDHSGRSTVSAEGGPSSGSKTEGDQHGGGEAGSSEGDEYGSEAGSSDGDQYFSD